MNGYIKILMPTFAVALLAMSGCDQKVMGENETLTFQAHQCGAYTLGCTLKKPIAVGGTVDVRIDGKFVNEDLELVAEDSSLFIIEPSDTGNPTRFLIRAMGSGSTHLQAVDEFGTVVDQVPVRTVSSDRLRIRPLAHMNEELNTFEDGVDTWRVPVGKNLSFFVGPDVGDKWDGMGKMEYEIVEMSQEIEDAIGENDSTDVAAGLFAFKAPLGMHEMVLRNTDQTLELRVSFIGEVM